MIRVSLFTHRAFGIAFIACANMGCAGATHAPKTAPPAPPPPPASTSVPAYSDPPSRGAIVGRVVCEKENASEPLWSDFIVPGTDARSRNLCATTFAMLECSKGERTTRRACSEEPLGPAPDVPAGSTILRRIADLNEWAELMDAAESDLAAHIVHYQAFATPGACLARVEAHTQRVPAPPLSGGTFSCFPAGGPQPAMNPGSSR